MKKVHDSRHSQMANRMSSIGILRTIEIQSPPYRDCLLDTSIPMIQVVTDLQSLQVSWGVVDLCTAVDPSDSPFRDYRRMKIGRHSAWVTNFPSVDHHL
jgi:hypothetical protein